MGWTHPVSYLRHGLWVENFTAAEDEQIRHGVNQGLTFIVIARQLHRTRHVVYCRAVRLGLHRPRRYRQRLSFT